MADQWSERADFLDHRAAAVTKALLDGADIGASDRVLALADGPGGIGLAAASLAAEVVSSDIAPTYADVVTARADAAGLTNVTAKVLDLEEIAEPDASFDAVVIREGLMFAAEPLAALGEIRRVLRDDGRLAAAVWGPKADNPWLAIVHGRGLDPGWPRSAAARDARPVRIGRRTAARPSSRTKPGSATCTSTTLSVRFHAPSFEEWWAHTSALAGPIATVVAGLSDEARAELLDAAAQRSRSLRNLRRPRHPRPVVSADGAALAGRHLRHELVEVEVVAPRVDLAVADLERAHDR